MRFWAYFLELYVVNVNKSMIAYIESYSLMSAASEMREAPDPAVDEKTSVITKPTNGSADIPSKDQLGPDKKVGQCHAWMTKKIDLPKGIFWKVDIYYE